MALKETLKKGKLDYSKLSSKEMAALNKEKKGWIDQGLDLVKDVAKGASNRINEVRTNFKYWGFKGLDYATEQGVINLQKNYDELESHDYLDLSEQGKKEYLKAKQSLDSEMANMKIGGEVMTRDKLAALSKGYTSGRGYTDPSEEANKEPEFMSREDLRHRQIENEFVTGAINSIHKKDWLTILRPDGNYQKYKPEDMANVVTTMYWKLNRNFSPIIEAIVKYEEMVNKGIPLSSRDRYVYNKAQEQLDSAQHFLVYAVDHAEEAVYGFDKILDKYMKETGRVNPLATKQNWQYVNNELFYTWQKLISEIGRGNVATNILPLASNLFTVWFESLFQKDFSGLYSLTHQDVTYGSALALHDSKELQEGVYNLLAKKDNTWNKLFVGATDIWSDLAEFFVPMGWLGKAAEGLELLSKTNKISKILKSTKALNSVDGFIKWASLLEKSGKYWATLAHVGKWLLRETAENILAAQIIKGSTWQEYTGADFTVDIMSSGFFWALWAFKLAKSVELEKHSTRRLFAQESAKLTMRFDDVTRSKLSWEIKEELTKVYLDMMETKAFTNPKSKTALKKLVAENAAALRTKADDIKRFMDYETEQLTRYAQNTRKFWGLVTQLEDGTLKRKRELSVDEYLKIKQAYIKNTILTLNADKSAYSKAKATFYTHQWNAIQKFAATYKEVMNYRADRMEEYIKQQFLGMTDEQRFFFEKWRERFNIPEAKTYKELVNQLFKFEALRDSMKAEWLSKNEDEFVKAMKWLDRVTYEEKRREYGRKRLVAFGETDKGRYKPGYRFVLSNMPYNEAVVADSFIALNGKEYFDFVKGLDIPTTDKEILIRSLSNDTGRRSRHVDLVSYTTDPDYARPFHNPLEVGFFVGQKGRVSITSGRDAKIVSTYSYEMLPVTEGLANIETVGYHLKDETGKVVGEFRILDSAYISSSTFPNNVGLKFEPLERGYNSHKVTEVIAPAPNFKKNKEKWLVSQIARGASRNTILKSHPQYWNIPRRLFNAIWRWPEPVPQKIKLLNKYAEVDFTNTVRLDATENKNVFWDKFAREHILKKKGDIWLEWMIGSKNHDIPTGKYYYRKGLSQTNDWYDLYTIHKEDNTIIGRMEFDRDGAMSIYMKQWDGRDRFYGNVHLPDMNGNVYIPNQVNKEIHMDDVKRLFWWTADNVEDLVWSLTRSDNPTWEQLIAGYYDDIYKPYYWPRLVDPAQQLEFIEFYKKNEDFLMSYAKISEDYVGTPKYKDIAKEFAEYRKNPEKQMRLIKDRFVDDAFLQLPKFDTAAEEFIYLTAADKLGYMPIKRDSPRRAKRMQNFVARKYFLPWLNESDAVEFMEVLKQSKLDLHTALETIEGSELFKNINPTAMKQYAKDIKNEITGAIWSLTREAEALDYTIKQLGEAISNNRNLDVKTHKRVRRSTAIRIAKLEEELDAYQQLLKENTEKQKRLTNIQDNYESTPLGQWLKVETKDLSDWSLLFKSSAAEKVAEEWKAKVLGKLANGNGIKALPEPPKPKEIPTVVKEYVEPPIVEVKRDVQVKPANKARIQAKYLGVDLWDEFKRTKKVPKSWRAYTKLDNDIVEEIFDWPINWVNRLPKNNEINYFTNKLKDIGISDPIIRWATEDFAVRDAWVSLCSLWYLWEANQNMLNRAMLAAGFPDISQAKEIYDSHSWLKDTIHSLVAYFDRYGGINTDGLRIHFKPYASSQRIKPQDLPVNNGFYQDLQYLYWPQAKHIMPGSTDKTKYFFSNETYYALNKGETVQLLSKSPDRLKTLFGDIDPKKGDSVFLTKQPAAIMRDSVNIGYWRATLDTTVAKRLPHIVSQDINAWLELLSKHDETAYKALNNTVYPVNKIYVEKGVLDEIKARYPQITVGEEKVLKGLIEKGKRTDINKMLTDSKSTTLIREPTRKVDAVIDSTLRTIDGFADQLDDLDTVVVTHSDVRGESVINQELIDKWFKKVWDISQSAQDAVRNQNGTYYKKVSEAVDTVYENQEELIIAVTNIWDIAEQHSITQC